MEFQKIIRKLDSFSYIFTIQNEHRTFTGGMSTILMYLASSFRIVLLAALNYDIKNLVLNLFC